MDVMFLKKLVFCTETIVLVSITYFVWNNGRR